MSNFYIILGLLLIAGGSGLTIYGTHYKAQLQTTETLGKLDEIRSDLSDVIKTLKESSKDEPERLEEIERIEIALKRTKLKDTERILCYVENPHGERLEGVRVTITYDGNIRKRLLSNSNGLFLIDCSLFVGTTPLRIELEKDGYQPQTQEIFYQSCKYKKPIYVTLQSQ
jgi:hypothetical protein